MTNKWVLEQARLETEGKLAKCKAQRDYLLAACEAIWRYKGALRQMESYAPGDWQDALDYIECAIAKTKGE